MYVLFVPDLCSCLGGILAAWGLCVFVFITTCIFYNIVIRSIPLSSLALYCHREYNSTVVVFITMPFA